MTESELKDLCSYTPKALMHWTSEVYGFGPIIREYGYYPSHAPLTIYMAHGLTMAEGPAPHELSNDAIAMLYFSPRLVRAYRQASTKPCYCVISPNVYYRRSRNIQRDSHPKGTIVFHAHTTPLIEDKMSLSTYITQLKNLPAKYHPLTVCLHYHDVNKGVHKDFMREGMEVVTVGSPHRPDFIKRFYDLVRSFRYATSNEIGSYMFYCIEMGIPFFLYGETPDLHNFGDVNIEMGKYDSYTRTEQYRKTKALFIQPTEEVTNAQRGFVEEELGVGDSISRGKLSLILYRGYLKIKLARGKRFLSMKWVKRVVANRAERLRVYADSRKLYGSEFARSLYTGRKDRTVTLFGHTLKYSDRFWFLHSMHEIFIDGTYMFRSKTETPYILDCGANIGLSVIDFKRQFPKARIVAFEPDLKNFELLTINLKSFGYDDVDLQQKAIWTTDALLSFASSDNSVGSKLAPGESTSSSGKVQAVALSSYLKDRHIDFLKIDIEGAEYDVIRSCREHLRNVDNFFIEYHSLPGEAQHLNEILTILTDSGFKYYIKEAWENRKHPFFLQEETVFDLQLNIFAYRIQI